MVVRAHAEHVDVPLEPIFRANDESMCCRSEQQRA